MDKFLIDPEFREKIPPLTEEEFTQLEENILSDGAVFSPLIVWDNTILDGHNRYEIIQEHPELVYAVHKMTFANRYEALSWICKNQLGRRNLTPQQKKYLIGQRYEAEKKVAQFHGNQFTLPGESGLGQIDPDHNAHGTRSRIAKETQTSDSYVKRAGQFARGVDAAEEALPGIKQDILTGAIKPTETAVADVARAEPEERPKLAAALKEAEGRSKKNDTQTPPVYHTPPQSKRDVMRQIAEISAEMERPKAPSAEKGMIGSMDGEVDSFIELCDHIFQECPSLLSDSGYKQEVIRVMRRLKEYIAKIEGGATS